MVKLKNLRPRCFFDISINQTHVGRIIFELFNDVCPKTCENFKALCTGEKGFGKLTGKPLHYKNVIFHRIVKNFIIQSGDFSQGNGKGGESIYGGTFEDESFHFKHEKPFLLSMANRGKNTNGSQFFITLAPAPHLDSVHVVFGHVISGHDIVLLISNHSVDKHSRPTSEIKIANCGELVPQIKQKEKSDSKSKREQSSDEDSSDSDSSSSDSDSSSSDSSNSNSSLPPEKSENGKTTLNAENVDENGKNDNDNVDNNEDYDFPFYPKRTIKINPEEIPEVPKNKFLSRNIPEKSNEDNRESKKFYRYSGSGKKIKGRGSIRYRTPSPNRSRGYRSATPPHWRIEEAKLRPYKDLFNNSNLKRTQNDVDSQSRARSRSRSNERYRKSPTNSGHHHNQHRRHHKHNHHDHHYYRSKRDREHEHGNNKKFIENKNENDHRLTMDMMERKKHGE